MHYVNLGTAGVKVSRVALGCLTFGSKRWRPWVLEEDEAVALIKRAASRESTSAIRLRIRSTASASITSIFIRSTASTR